MQCARCGTENPAENKYCGECGSSLAPACLQCGAANPAGKRFCGECGSPLAATPDREGSPPGEPSAGRPPAASLVAERRVCSVLFCDLVGFTALSEARDPEEVRELLSRYFAVARTVIGRYGGVVEKFIGDAVMAVWGTPTATEEDAERAVRAGLDLVDAVAQLGDRGRARRGCPPARGWSPAGGGDRGGGRRKGWWPATRSTPPHGYRRPRSRARSSWTRGPGGSPGRRWRSPPPASTRSRARLSRSPLWRAGRVLSGVGGAQRHRRVGGAVRRPRRGAAAGQGAVPRLRGTQLPAAGQRQRRRRESASHGWAGSSRSTSTGWSTACCGTAAAVCPTATGWPSGRWPRWSGSGSASRRRTATAVAADKLAPGSSSGSPTRGARVRERAPRPAARHRHTAGRRPVAGPRGAVRRVAAVLRAAGEHRPGRAAGRGPAARRPGLLDFLEHLLDWARDVPIFVLTLARPELQERRPGWGAGAATARRLTLDATRRRRDGRAARRPRTGHAAEARSSRRRCGREGIPLYAVETVRMLVDRDVVQPIEGVYRLVGDIGELAVPATLQSLLAARLDALDPAARSLVGWSIRVTPESSCFGSGRPRARSRLPPRWRG